MPFKQGHLHKQATHAVLATGGVTHARWPSCPHVHNQATCDIEYQSRRQRGAHQLAGARRICIGRRQGEAGGRLLC